MKINNLNKIVLALALTTSLVGCTNADNNAISASETQAPTEVAENVDMIENATEESKDIENTEESEKKQNEKTTLVVKKKEENKVETSNEKPAEKEATVENSDVNYETRDGSYTSTLLASKNGDREPEYGYATVKEAEAKEGTLRVVASLDYRVDPENYDNLEELENKEYNFKIDENTKFLSGGGLAEPTYYTVEEFNKFYNEVKESGLGLIIEVKNGVATEVSIVS